VGDNGGRGGGVVSGNSKGTSGQIGAKTRRSCMERGRRKSDGRRKGGRVQLWYDGGYERPKFRRMTMDEGIDG